MEDKSSSAQKGDATSNNTEVDPTAELKAKLKVKEDEVVNLDSTYSLPRDCWPMRMTNLDDRVDYGTYKPTSLIFNATLHGKRSKQRTLPYPILRVTSSKPSRFSQ